MAHDHDEVRAMIVDAAREVFSRFGYKKATLDDIASSLYKAKSSIYYYFKSKEDVFRAVIDFEAERARAIVREAVENAGSPENKIRTYFTTVTEFIRETSSYYQLIQEDVLEVLSFSEEVKARHRNSQIKLVADILQEGVETSDFIVSDVEGTAEAIIIAFDGFFGPFCNYDAFSDKKFENLLHILLYGIKKR